MILAYFIQTELTVAGVICRDESSSELHDVLQVDPLGRILLTIDTKRLELIEEGLNWHLLCDDIEGWVLYGLVRNLLLLILLLPRHLFVFEHLLLFHAYEDKSLCSASADEEALLT